MIEKARRAAVLAFEVAGEVGELFVAEVQGHEFDGFSLREAVVSDIEAIPAQPLAEGAAVGSAEVPLDGAGRDPAESGDFARLELGAMGKGLPIEVLVGAHGGGEIQHRQMIGLNHAFRFNNERFTSSVDNKDNQTLAEEI